jgi:hypothetical protein
MQGTKKLSYRTYCPIQTVRHCRIAATPNENSSHCWRFYIVSACIFIGDFIVNALHDENEDERHKEVPGCDSSHDVVGSKSHSFSPPITSFWA